MNVQPHQDSSSFPYSNHTRLIRAYNFDVETVENLTSLKDSLAQVTGLEWEERSNHYYGDYLRAESDSNNSKKVIYRIFDHNGTYAFDMLNENGPYSTEEFNNLTNNFKRQLESIGASDFEQTDDFY